MLAGYGAEADAPLPGAGDAGRAARRAARRASTPRRRSTTTSRPIGKGLSKIMSKMGISTYMSLLRRADLRGRRPGEGLRRQVLPRHRQPGRRHRRVRGGRGGDAHAPRRLRRRPGARATCSTPAASTPGACAARSTCGRPTRSPSCSTARAPTSYETYKEYAQIINDQSRRHMTLRGLFEFKVDPSKAIPLDEVEPATEIVKRFATGAMSLGSISHRGAHARWPSR
ncbi:MAG: glutamate synthase-related protein [Comamonadaceae bacterium]|nr:glutamate synthase-related protein [Comamonadaceae bacterium]